MRKNTLVCLLIIFPLFLISQKIDSQFEYLDNIDDLVPVLKESTTVGRCCKLGKTLSKLTGGLTDAYVIQSEKNQDGSYTIFYLQGIINYDKELTRYAGGSFKVLSKFHLANEDKFNRLRFLMVEGSKGFKASAIKKNEKYIDISEILVGGEDEGAKLFLYYYNNKIIKYVQLVKFEKDTGYKSASGNIFSKFIGQLFGGKVVD